MMETHESAILQSSAPKTGMFQTIEATTSVIFAFFLGVTMMFAGVVYIDVLKQDHYRAIWLTGAVVLALAEGTFLFWLFRGLMADDLHPFIPSFSLRQWRWPMVLRPAVAIWWIAHLAVAAGLLFALEHLVLSGKRSEQMDAGVIIALTFAVWTLTHCSLLYFLLALTALVKLQWLVHFIWRYRIAIDAMVAATFFLITWFSPHATMPAI